MDHYAAEELPVFWCSNEELNSNDLGGSMAPIYRTCIWHLLDSLWPLPVSLGSKPSEELWGFQLLLHLRLWPCCYSLRPLAYICPVYML